MTKNYAHRGFSGNYPENTMLAFKKAVEAGADGIELDVHFSKDKELVIIDKAGLIDTSHVKFTRTHIVLHKIGEERITYLQAEQIRQIARDQYIR